MMQIIFSYTLYHNAMVSSNIIPTNVSASVWYKQMLQIIFPKQYNGLREHQQLTSVLLNRFYSLSKIHPHPSLFLTDNIKLDGISTKMKWKIYFLSTLYFKFWRCFLWKKFLRYNHQTFYFLLFFISFYICRYNF